LECVRQHPGGVCRRSVIRKQPVGVERRLVGFGPGQVEVQAGVPQHAVADFSLTVAHESAQESGKKRTRSGESATKLPGCARGALRWARCGPRLVRK